MASNNAQAPQYEAYDTYKKVQTSEEVTETHSPASEPRVETAETSPRRSKTTVFKRWWLEVLSILVSIGGLIAIYVLLKQYDGKRTSDWTMSINLTTLVAILSTLGRMSLVTIVSQVIAQGKWTQFWLCGKSEIGKNVKGRPLKDMDVYDSASRGDILSSMQLFSKVARSPSVLFSVLAMLLSIAMASFAQQAVRTINCEYADDVINADIPSIQTIGNFGDGPDGLSWREWDEMKRHRLSYTTKASLISSIANPSGVESEIRPTCSSGNCTFPRYADDRGRVFTHRAVGFCSKCVDTTAQTNYSSFAGQGGGQLQGVLSTDVMAWSLPTRQNVSYRWAMTHSFAGTGGSSGYNTEYDTAILNVETDGMQFDWIFRDERNEASDFINLAVHGYANISFLSLQDVTLDLPPNQQHEKWRSQALASAYTIYPCLKSYLATMVDSKYAETLVSTETLPLYADLMMIVENGANPGGFYKIVWPSDAIAAVSPCLVDGQVYTKSNMSSAPGAVKMTQIKYDDTWAAFDQNVGTRVGETINDNPNAVNITAPPQCIFGVEHWDWFKSMGDFFGETLQGTCGVWGTDTTDYILPSCVTDYDATTRYQMNPANPWWLEEITKTLNRTTAEISKWLDSVTESMMRRFRLSGESYGSQPWSNDFRSINGTVMYTTTCFAMEMQWLTFPLVLTLIVTVVLIWTLIKGLCGLGTTRGREMIWKSSILPFVYHQERFMPIDDYDRAAEFYKKKEQGWAPLMDLKSMEKDAKEYKVAFDG